MRDTFAFAQSDAKIVLLTLWLATLKTKLQNTVTHRKKNSSSCSHTNWIIMYKGILLQKAENVFCLSSGRKTEKSFWFEIARCYERRKSIIHLKGEHICIDLWRQCKTTGTIVVVLSTMIKDQKKISNFKSNFMKYWVHSSRWCYSYRGRRRSTICLPIFHISNYRTWETATNTIAVM